MKKNIVFALLASAIFLAGLTGCVSQKEHEGVVAQVQALESENTRLKAEALELSAKVDEYENGKENLLVKVRNHFEKKEYDEAKQLAQTLHKKFNGTSEDQQAQQIIQQIDKTLEEQKRTKEAAESKAAAEKKKNARDKAREIIRVSKVYTGTPNSAGGVDLYIVWKNMSDKTIKYVDFEAVPINAVGDVVSCEIRMSSTFYGQETGPYKKGQGNSGAYLWENAWYNPSITSAQIRGIEVTYMDGSSVTLKQDEIQYVRY